MGRAYRTYRDFAELSAAQRSRSGAGVENGVAQIRWFVEKAISVSDGLVSSAPIDGKPHPQSHLHAEFYPPYRTPEKLKYLAGTELAAGFFAMDALPEEKARELQQIQVSLDA